MLPIDYLRYLCSLKNPFPRPDRRYRLAKGYLAEGVLPSISHDDKATWKIFRFLRAKETFSQPKERVEMVLLKYPDIACACDLHHGKMKFLRPILEAYLLARKDAQALAVDLRVNWDTIKWFKLAFYDVDRYLDHQLLVLGHLVANVDEHGHKVLDETTLWKMTGYLRGPDALDELLYNTRGTSQAVDDGSVSDWLGQQVQTMRQVKQLLAMSHLQPDNDAHISLLSRFVGQAERHGKGETAESSLTSWEQHVNVMLQEIPWAKGPENRPAPLKEWDNLAAELRAQEEMLVAAGEKPLELAEVKNLHMPSS